MSTIEEKIRFAIERTNKNVIPMKRELVVVCNNNVRDALLLTQLIYWCSRSTNGKKGWVYESARELEEQLGLTESMIRSATKNLLRLNFIETKNQLSEGHPTKHYRVKENEILAAIYRLQAKELGEEIEDYMI